MKSLAGKFSFKVPEGHSEAGKKIEKGFSYVEAENDEEATKVLTHSYDADKNEWVARKKAWKLMDLVNDNLKTDARANAYQSATVVYRPSEVSQEDIKERMIRDAIRLGLPEDIARQMVENTLAAMAKDKPAEEAEEVTEVVEPTTEG